MFATFFLSSIKVSQCNLYDSYKYIKDSWEIQPIYLNLFHLNLLMYFRVLNNFYHIPSNVKVCVLKKMCLYLISNSPNCHSTFWAYFFKKTVRFNSWINEIFKQSFKTLSLKLNPVHWSSQLTLRQQIAASWHKQERSANRFKITGVISSVLSYSRVSIVHSNFLDTNNVQTQ